MPRILIIEDEPEIRTLLRYNLKKMGYELQEAENANDALIWLGQLNFELILLDLMLPGLSGMEFLKLIRHKTEHNSTRVLVVSALSEEGRIVEALQQGADDYVTKPFSVKLLLARIETLLRRGREIAPNRIQSGEIELDFLEHKTKVKGEAVKLTLKEFELLTHFLRSPGRAFSRDELLSEIWGYDSQSQTRTVDAHVASLRKKLTCNGHRICSLPKVGYGLDL